MAIKQELFKQNELSWSQILGPTKYRAIHELLVTLSEVLKRYALRVRMNSSKKNLICVFRALLHVNRMVMGNLTPRTSVRVGWVCLTEISLEKYSIIMDFKLFLKIILKLSMQCRIKYIQANKHKTVKESKLNQQSK